ncbi:MAG: hypothetical protein FJW96_06105 [Actinobacteria bacterium]|nr:hypothetical protein [Actinomycetota bacterium]
MATITESTQSDHGGSAEDTRVFRWRAEQFGKLGFSEEMSWMLAGSSAELGVSRSLVQAGCPLDLVARIVL